MISNEKFDYLIIHQTFAQLTREAFDHSHLLCIFYHTESIKPNICGSEYKITVNKKIITYSHSSFLDEN